MLIKLTELTQRILGRLHEKIQFYDCAGRQDNNHVLGQAGPLIKEVLREQLTVSVQDDEDESKDDEG